jgi:glucose/arabinose dehydrogenase
LLANINAGPAQIHQFPLTKSDRPTQGYHWNNGTVLAWGVRNGVGIALSKDGKDWWEIENSSDNIRWRDVDIHVDSPGELKKTFIIYT